MNQQVSAADGALQRGAKIVNESKTTIIQELTSIQNKLSGIGSAWAGSGSNSFQATFGQWQEKARRITSTLDQFEENLLQSQTTYTATDDASSSSHKNLQSRLG